MIVSTLISVLIDQQSVKHLQNGSICVLNALQQSSPDVTVAWIPLLAGYIRHILQR